MSNVFETMMNIKTVTKEVTCEKHGLVKVEVVVFPDGRETFDCPLCEKDQEAENLKKIEELEKQQLIEKYKESNIEQEYWNKDLDDYKPESESQKKALFVVKELLDAKIGKVILLGSNGVGKTMLGSCAVKKMGGKIYSMYEISTMIRQSYTGKGKTELEIVKELADIPFLVIDELGRTKGSDAELNWLSYVLDKRHTRNKPFMLLSNTHLLTKCPEHGCSMCFENYLNNDILSRLRQNSKMVIVDGEDFRRNKNK